MNAVADLIHMPLIDALPLPEVQFLHSFNVPTHVSLYLCEQILHATLSQRVIFML